VYANTSKIMVDAKGSGNLLYLPLDKLMQAAAIQAPMAVTPDSTAPAGSPSSVNTLSGAVPPQTETTPGVERSGDYRSRGSLEGRDRGNR
jgi:membrane protease subunit HflK